MQHWDMGWDATLVVRGRFADQPAVRSIINSINPDTPVEFQSMDDVIAGTIVRERFQTSLLAVFAGFALLLSMVGIYGLLGYTVTRRTSELGVRMALGASRRTVLSMVLSQGGKLVLIGTVLGLSCAFLLSRALTDMLYGVTASDPASFAIVAVLFACVALAACCLPAWRASRIDPNVALRYE
jgi:putative ABC transport system permease protein